MRPLHSSPWMNWAIKASAICGLVLGMAKILTFFAAPVWAEVVAQTLAPLNGRVDRVEQAEVKLTTLIEEHEKSDQMQEQHYRELLGILASDPGSPERAMRIRRALVATH